MKRITLTLAVLLAAVALAGDEPIATVAYTGTAACSAQLRPNSRYAVQPTTDAYVLVTADAALATATSAAVKVGADKLYDAYTTRTKRYICFVRVSTSGDGKIFLYENGSQP